jgi:hypothetical protein
MIAIHQPNYLPWLGFVDKARIVDTFVLLDSVPFTRGSVINRNKIKTNVGPQWITVPVHHLPGTLIADILTVDSDWEERHWKTFVFNYSRAEHFQEFVSPLQELYAKRWSKLAELNETLIRFLLDCFGLRPKILRSSELGVKGKGSELLIQICRAAGEREYLSGMGAMQYMDLALFERHGITVQFQRFEHPRYHQLFGEFVPNLSAIDYVFNCGGGQWWSHPS